MTAKAEQFSEVDNFAKRLVAEGHTDTVVIKEQQDILRCVSSKGNNLGLITEI